jgi:hypothetical protein
MNTCTRYSSSCRGESAIAEVTAECGGSTDEHTLCPMCIAGLAWTLYVRNGDEYATDTATVTVTDLIGEMDQEEARQEVLQEIDSEFAYGNYSAADVADSVAWQV